MGKDLTEVRSSQRTLIPDAEDWEYYELPALRGIARKAKQEPTYRFRDLSRCLNEDHLRHAFSKPYSCIKNVWKADFSLKK
jgi:RNA-directed DNA polymerase